MDRLPPSELLDRVLAESAYAAEIGGPAYRQARENLKKIRGLVRRLQNRGYATLGRIVDHLSQLVAGGDESNAIVDAVDAVNLMTAHAAKGLEFPVVFVVNMHRGSGGSPDPIRVWPAAFGRDDEEEPTVSIGVHESDADRDLDAREAEEGKRLLYVAMTRARDRLYLAATMSADGRFAPGKGGLGRTLPRVTDRSFSIPRQPPPTSTLVWTGASGHHRFRVLRPAADAAVTFDDPIPVDDVHIEDFVPLDVQKTPRVVASRTGQTDWEAHADDSDARSSIDVGVLVHRALAAGVDDPEVLLGAAERTLLGRRPAVGARRTQCLGAYSSASTRRGSLLRCQHPVAAPRSAVFVAAGRRHDRSRRDRLHGASGPTA